MTALAAAVVAWGAWGACGPARASAPVAPHAALPPGSAETYTRYAVAADHPLASRAGESVLRAGGNAVDVAVATSFALSVVRPFSCGIGGGGFMVIALKEDPRGEIAGPVRVALNYREICPAAVGPDFYERAPQSEAPDRATLSTFGGRAVATPGTVAGLLFALDRYGTKPRAEVLAPAIRLAREGFEVDGAYEKAAADLAEKFEAEPARKTRFAFVWSRFLKEGRVKAGDRITLPEQAEVLEAIATRGVDGFYRGPVAGMIVDAVRADGGVLTLEDLAAYAVRAGDPLTFTFKKRQFLAMPPPSSGGLAMGQILGILSRVNLDEHTAQGVTAPYLTLMVEAMKHAFADRAAWLGDPAFVDVPVARLLSPAYLDQRAKFTRVGKSMRPPSYGTRPEGAERAPGAPDDGGTSHLSVIDDQGNAVACTETINLEFGSLVAVGGFCLNNEMDDFTTRPGEANAFGLAQSERNLPAPGKRPLSSMSPTIVLSPAGDPEVVAGASGGPRIISATTQVVLNVLQLGWGAERAVGAPRLHHQWSPYVLEYERAYEEVRWQGMPVLTWLRKQMNECKPATRGAAVQAIVRKPDGTLEAACDPRKGGSPAGR